MYQSFSVRFIETLELRESEVHSNDTLAAISRAKKSADQLDFIFSKPEFAEVADDLLSNMRIADKNRDPLRYVAVKVIMKIIRCCDAIATGHLGHLDRYSWVIIGNLLHSAAATGKAQLSSKGAMMSLSKHIEYDATAQVELIKRRFNCSPGTAGSQTGSTRMMLNYLGLAEVCKGMRNDTIILKSNPRADQLVKLFNIAQVNKTLEAQEKNSD